MLRVTLLGNLGSDPEARYTATGNVVVTLRVAVNQIRKGPDGERQENTEWFRVNITGPRTEFAKRLSKGNRVMVVGRLSISHYTNRDGEPRTGFDVWADDFESMTPRPRDSEAIDGDGEGAEPAFAGAGISSIVGGDAAGGAATTSANGNGNGNGRAKRAGQGASASAGDLEDLPF